MEGVITKIEVQKKNKERVNIFIDKEFAFACSMELVYSNGLKAGKTVDLETLKGIALEESYIKAKNDALKTIERSYKSEKEIVDKLVKKGYEEKTIIRAIDFLKSYSFLDDDKFAEMYIRDKIKAQGKNKIKYSLIRKGIKEDIIQEKLKGIGAEDEQRTALRLGEKKYAILLKSEQDSKKLYKKLGDYLIRNGYNSEITNEVLNKVVKEQIVEIPPEIVKDTDELLSLARKRYEVLKKSEKDPRKLFKKLSDYLLRRGYPWGDIKTVLKQVTQNEIQIEEY